MILYVNENNEIKDVNTTDDKSLIAVEINDDGKNPFTFWSVAKICCYKVEVHDGEITSYVPYVDSRLIEHIDKLGKQSEINTSDITDNRDGLIETFDTTMSNSSDISDCRTAIIELYDMLTGGNE